MKRPTLSCLAVIERCLLLSGAAVLCAFSAPAQSPAPVPETPVEWPNLCSSAARELLVVTTESGDTVEGYCVFVQHDELTLRTADGKVVKIARGTLRNVLALTVPEHRLKALRKGMKEGFREGWKMTFSPLAPLWFSGDPGHARLGCRGGAVLRPR